MSIAELTQLHALLGRSLTLKCWAGRFYFWTIAPMAIGIIFCLITNRTVPWIFLGIFWFFLMIFATFAFGSRVIAKYWTWVPEEPEDRRGRP